MKKAFILGAILTAALLSACSSGKADNVESPGNFGDNLTSAGENPYSAYSKSTDSGSAPISEQTETVPQITQKIDGKISDNTLIYTNLIGEDVQNYVKQILISSGIPENRAEKVFEWVNDYNRCMGSCENFDLKDEFTSVCAPAVDYGDYYPMSTLWYKTNKRDYADILCRLAAFELIGDSIHVKNPVEESRYGYDSEDGWLNSDYDAVCNNPLVDFNESEREKYFSLYAPIELEKECDEREMYDIILKEWERRGVSFDTINCSLITIWLKGDGLTAAGHAAVLAEYGNELLLFEKTNPQSPYQATKFSTLEQVKRYMFETVDLDNSRYGLETGTYVVMKNEKII